jgi:hypothetical protein
MNTQQIDEKALFNAARRITDSAAQVEYLTQVCGSAGRNKLRMFPGGGVYVA